MQGSRGDTDVKNRLLDSVGEGAGGMISENSMKTCTWTRSVQKLEIKSFTLYFGFGLCESRAETLEHVLVRAGKRACVLNTLSQ